MLSSVQAAPFAPKPFPVKEVRPGELESHTRAGEVSERVAVQGLGDLPLAQQCADARFDSKCPL
ncbi:MAG TPA: hypothetical protein VK680_13925 [Solirubrobacteraceae bacterium]|nr:hypothetical protein [Solirubrobacteraceae bacterium]